ncbi:MAG TPA: hypothetical protein VMU84_18795 [Thermoanaerobaculia bacterium]|nr:hypothetical protein [Thermoanaerobaculia bacterium]
MRRTAAIVWFIALIGAGIQPWLLRLPFSGRDELAATYATIPDGGAESYVAFLRGVRERTQRGDAIVIVFASSEPKHYEYAWYRASYLLAGRDVLPVTPENFARAKWIAAWRRNVRAEGFAPAWSGADGVLLRRK